MKYQTGMHFAVTGHDRDGLDADAPQLQATWQQVGGIAVGVVRLRRLADVAIFSLNKVMSGRLEATDLHTILRGESVYIDKILVAQGDLRIDLTRIEGIHVGDKFSDIGAGATIVNRSLLSNALNTIGNKIGPEVAEALKAVSAVVDEAGNADATENFNGFTEELGKSEPRKSRLKSFWNGLVDALPSIAQLGDATAKIASLFS